MNTTWSFYPPFDQNFQVLSKSCEVEQNSPQGDPWAKPSKHHLQTKQKYEEKASVCKSAFINKKKECLAQIMYFDLFFFLLLARKCEMVQEPVLAFLMFI